MTLQELNRFIAVLNGDSSSPIELSQSDIAQMGSDTPRA
jgi:hypothetical protein